MSGAGAVGAAPALEGGSFGEVKFCGGFDAGPRANGAESGVECRRFWPRERLTAAPVAFADTKRAICGRISGSGRADWAAWSKPGSATMHTRPCLCRSR